MTDVQLRKGVGQMRRQRIGAALGDQIDGLGCGQHIHRLGEGVGLDGGGKLIDRLAGGREKAGENAGLFILDAGLLKRDQAFLIAQRPLTQPLAEDALQVGKTFITKMMGEAYQRRGLDICGRRNACRCAEGDFVGIAKREGGDLRQSLRHGILALYDDAAQAFEIRGTLVRVSILLSMPRLLAAMPVNETNIPYFER